VQAYVGGWIFGFGNGGGTPTVVMDINVVYLVLFANEEKRKGLYAFGGPCVVRVWWMGYFTKMLLTDFYVLIRFRFIVR
jgi:hypothetical protein